MAAAIRGFNALEPGGAVPRPDLIIVARGGGSVEDLWGFNDEDVVRAAAASAIPLISAVGHETDTTLIDHAADRRAPTPTAAAEMAVPVRADLSAHVAGLEERRRRAVARQLETRRQRLSDLGRALGRPEALLAEWQQRHDAVASRLEQGLRLTVQGKRADLHGGAPGRFGPRLLRTGLDKRAERVSRAMLGLGNGLTRTTDRAAARLAALPLRPARLTERTRRGRERLDRASSTLLQGVTRQLDTARRGLSATGRMLGSLGYTETLRRGFAVVRDEQGALVPTAVAAERATRLEIEFADGKFSPDSPPRPKAQKPEEPGGQGSLF